MAYHECYTPALSTHTKHMAIDGHMCFHGRLFADLVKTWRCIKGSVEPVNSSNKEMCGTKLLLITLSAYPADCVCFCDLSKTQYCCLSSNGRYNQAPAAHHPPPSPHPPPTCSTPVHATHDITVAVKIVTQNSTVLYSWLRSWNSYKTLAK